MPRVIPKKRKPATEPAEVEAIPHDAWPEPAPPPRWDNGLEVVESFNCEGVHFERGERVTAESELVQRILAEKPFLFRLTEGS